MSTSEKYLLGTQATLLSTELDGLANNTLVLGGAFNNTVGAAGDGYTLCDVELLVKFVSAPALSTAVVLWCVKAQDGTLYEDGGVGVTPARRPNLVIEVAAINTIQRINKEVLLPWGVWKPLLKNDNTGSAFDSTGHVLKIRPATHQGV